MNRREFFKLATKAAAAGLILPTMRRSMVGYTTGLIHPEACEFYGYGPVHEAAYLQQEIGEMCGISPYITTNGPLTTLFSGNPNILR